MKRYIEKEITEKELEDRIRQAPDLIESGLMFLTQQHRTSRGPLDLLLVDDGRALVVAELKTFQDDSMLWQGIDYYDYVATHIEALARSYPDRQIDVAQKPRLFLIAASFSELTVTRCKWVDLPISLFEWQCLALLDDEGKEEDDILVFFPRKVPARPAPEEPRSIEKSLTYITDDQIRGLAEAFLKEVDSWKDQRITKTPISWGISLKAAGKVFAYLTPMRKSFTVSYYNEAGAWTDYKVTS
ncbi:endonuclease NucS, partial [Dehalococcoidia bacterium]|nr:endonuclease NucS [Dehalococcoidia bacterium]